MGLAALAPSAACDSGSDSDDGTATAPSPGAPGSGGVPPSQYGYELFNW